jgi:hypothetical protein
MADETKVPKALDWVKARAECSIDYLFIALTAVVNADTEAAAARSDESTEFEVKRVTVDGFMVSKTFNDGGLFRNEVIAFDRKSDHVLVEKRTRDSSTKLFKAMPHVDIQGECKFEVDGVPLEPWQVSKKALESFFFERGLAPTPNKK